MPPETAGWNGGKIHRPGPLRTLERRIESMASYRRKGKVWYFRFVDADGIQHERKGCTDRRETEGMAASAEAEAAKIRGGYIDPKDPAYLDHERRPLADHLVDFQAALQAKGGTIRHAKVTTYRARRVLDLGACPSIRLCSRIAHGFRWALAFSATAPALGAHYPPLNSSRRCRSGAKSSEDCGSSRSVATRPTPSPVLVTKTCGFPARI